MCTGYVDKGEARREWDERVEEADVPGNMRGPAGGSGAAEGLVRNRR